MDTIASPLLLNGYEVRSLDSLVFSAIRDLCATSGAPVHPGPPPRSYLFREQYEDHLIRKSPRKYTEEELAILSYEDQFNKLLPDGVPLISSQDPPALFPLTEGCVVMKHSHEHIGSAYVASLVLENKSEDPILVWPRGSQEPERLILTPGSLLLMTGDCQHGIERVRGALTVLAYDFCFARGR